MDNVVIGPTRMQHHAPVPAQHMTGVENPFSFVLKSDGVSSNITGKICNTYNLENHLTLSTSRTANDGSPLTLKHRK